jgi:hypothetical protein
MFLTSKFARREPCEFKLRRSFRDIKCGKANFDWKFFLEAKSNTKMIRIRDETSFFSVTIYFFSFEI